MLPEGALACRDEIFRKMEGVLWNSDLARELVSCHIISHWLEGIIAKCKLPTSEDTSTGYPIKLVNDRYRVGDWQTLEALLALEPDVEGDRKEGWVRFTSIEEHGRQPQAALQLKGNDTLDVFCQTQELADETRKWLMALAGKTLSYQMREMIDPLSEKILESVPDSLQTD